MAGKFKQQQPLSKLAAFQTEVRDGRLWHIPPPVEMLKYVDWRPIWCAGYDVIDVVCGKVVSPDKFKIVVPKKTGGQFQFGFCSIECKEQFRADVHKFVPDLAAAKRAQEKHWHHQECIPCCCPPGPQIRGILASAFEVALIGGRGSAKSECTFGFLIKGNPFAKGTDLKGADASYLAHPDYHFIVLRKNLKDLEDFWARAKKFFGRFGGDPSESPTRKIKFPSGAFGIFDHLSDSDAFEKYQGQEFVRMVVEEATQIPSEKLYLQVRASCRSPKPELVSQVMLTANPGGPGGRWFNARFVDLKHPDGRPVKYGEVYREPLIDDERLATRQLIFSTVDDNPILLATGYDKQLDSYKISQPTLYRRWRLGDLKAVEGAFFESFRRERQPGEPENACHVIPPRKMEAHWPKAIACDWGYSHPTVAGWGCWHPSKQLHIYREFMANRMGAVEIGAEIAKRSISDLKEMENPHLNLYLSHDAFARTNEGANEAEQIAMGVNMVLGPNAAFVLDPNEEESLLEDEAAWSAVMKRYDQRKRMTTITIVNAGQKRRGNMNRIREYLRWWPIETERTVYDESVARRIIQTEGALAYSEYKKRCETVVTEVLPKLQIHCNLLTNEGCPEVIGAIEGAIEKESNPEEVEKQDGDDALDMAAYLIGNFNYSEGIMPKERVVSEKLRAMKEQMPGISTMSLIMAARQQEHALAQQSAGRAFALPHMRSRRPRVN